MNIDEHTRENKPSRGKSREKATSPKGKVAGTDNLKIPANNGLFVNPGEDTKPQNQFNPQWKVAESELQDRLDGLTILPGGYLITDSSGFVLECDHSIAVLLRSSPHRLPGKPLLSFIHPHDRANYRAHLVQLRQTNQVLEWTTTLQVSEGKLVPAILTAGAIAQGKDEPIKLRWFIRDITKQPLAARSAYGTQKELEERVVERTRELMVANQLLALEIENREKVEEELRRSQDGLEKRVQERTNQLAEANTRLTTELTERKRAEDAAARHARELSALNSAIAALHSTLELEPLLSKILDSAVSAIPAGEKGMLHLTARETGQLEMRAVIGYTDSRIQKFNFAGSKGYVAKAVRERKPLLINDVQVDPTIRYEGTIPEVRAIQSAIVAPLIQTNEVLGALSLDSSQKSAFTDDDLSILVSLAATVTAAIRNAQLHAEVQKLALTDSMTNIYNRRGFFEIGRREVERSHRFGRPLSAIMFDIDFFKNVNDTYGHANGDRVLRQISDRISKNIREIDILGRYGGDEFTILLPETDLFVATNVAERLRLSIVDAPFDIDEASLRITISLGVAKATADTIDLASLLDQADMALYAAKQGGRNRVEVG